MFLSLCGLVGAVLPLRVQTADSIPLTTGLAITGLGAGGRAPVVTDAILARIVRGEHVAPVAGDSVTAGDRTLIWRGVQAGADGSFSGIGSGYVFLTYDSPTDSVKLLEATGDNMVYVNGQPRAGDPYGTGCLRLPVALHTGVNEFMFSVGRGSLRARLLPAAAPVQLDTGDITRPDLIPDDHGDLFGGVVVINSTPDDATDLSIACSGAGKDLRTPVPRVPALSLRKVRFNFPAGATAFDLILMRGDKPLHSVHLTVDARKHGDAYMRTFESSIDGSVQYYAVRPSSLTDTSNALILSLHGAGVEAYRQASAYTVKPWATVVAPTNRRPFGFDWEDWGRMDGMEVLDIAGAAIPHDPKRVVVTGHSMGGHGTWSLGTLFPSRFAATAPSAGWISFWSYAGGWEPRDPTPPEAMLRRSMSPSDTLARVQNLAAERVYILHGDKDENVPVGQARKMSSTLSQLGIEFGYHEEPGAPHWWGDRCMDYPDLMSLLEQARLSDFHTVDFTTPDPGISADCGWLRILQQTHPRELSHVKGEPSGLATENVRALTILADEPSLKLDGRAFTDVKANTTFIRTKDSWRLGSLPAGAREADFCGPVKHGFNDRVVLVYGTTGTSDENQWMRSKARYDAETFYYRGNGAVEAVSDTEFLKTGYGGRNVVVYGNADTNRAWRALIGRAPLRLRRGELHAGARQFKGEGYSVMFVYPSARRLVVAIGGTGLTGMRATDRLPIFTSGVAYPDWTVFGPDTAEKGTKGILGAGFFGPEWGFNDGDVAWAGP